LATSVTPKYRKVLEYYHP